MESDKDRTRGKTGINWRKIYLAVFITGVIYILAMVLFTAIFNKP